MVKNKRLWLFGVEVVIHGSSVMEQAVSRTNVHLVDVGCSLDLVIPVWGQPLRCVGLLHEGTQGTIANLAVS